LFRSVFPGIHQFPLKNLNSVTVLFLWQDNNFRNLAQNSAAAENWNCGPYL